MTAVIERMQDYNLPITGDMYTLLQFIILTSYAALIDSLEDPNMALHVYKQAKRDVCYSILRLMKIVVSKRSIRKSFVSTIMLLWFGYIAWFPWSIQIYWHEYKYCQNIHSWQVESSIFLWRLLNILQIMNSNKPYERDLIMITGMIHLKELLLNA